MFIKYILITAVIIISFFNKVYMFEKIFCSETNPNYQTTLPLYNVKNIKTDFENINKKIVDDKITANSIKIQINISSEQMSERQKRWMIRINIFLFLFYSTIAIIVYRRAIRRMAIFIYRKIKLYLHKMMIYILNKINRPFLFKGNNKSNFLWEELKRMFEYYKTKNIKELYGLQLVDKNKYELAVIHKNPQTNIILKYKYEIVPYYGKRHDKVYRRINDIGFCFKENWEEFKNKILSLDYNPEKNDKNKRNNKKRKSSD